MFEGILPIWKEKGMTSHDVVFKLRKILKMKKIGHTGTLDPDVEGVLLVCLGKATKLVEFMMDGHKIYQGQICLGYSTTTEDASGDEVERKPVLVPITNDVIDQMMQSFVGNIQQIPPMYSAVKVNGRKLYEYARLNLPVERPVRQAQIYEFIRLSEPRYDSENKLQTWDFHVDCGKGTYVRTLAVDLGLKLGYPAHMSKLIRYATGGFCKEQALTLEQVAQKVANQEITSDIYPINQAKLPFQSVQLSEEQYHEIKFGKRLPINYFGNPIKEPVTLYYQNELIAIYYPHPSKPDFMKPKKMFI